MSKSEQSDHNGASPDQSPALDSALAALREPISATDPSGPDLDLEGDADYLNFFAQVEGILPTSFFSLEDGRPFDPSTIDINGQLASIQPLLERSRDIRLLTAQARLLILKKDLAGFAVSVAAIAEWLDGFWETVHPRPQNGDLEARRAAISALDLTTVIFPLQYAPLLEGRRIGSVTYRGWMIATEEVKPRGGEAAVAASAITEAIADAEPTILAATRKHLTLLKSSLDRIQKAFATHGQSAGLASLPPLVGKMLALSDPYASAVPEAPATEPAKAEEAYDPPPPRQNGPAVQAGGGAPNSIADATQALAAIADYYSRSEPSSPALPLVRQAHQLIGKSFLDVMRILMPSQVENAAFQIGTEQVFELPLEKLSSLSEVTQGNTPSGPSDFDELADSTPPAESPPSRYHLETRAQAMALLDQVQRYFRHFEPSSPVPMLCERARSLAERDFMGVLRDVLPKSALKGFNTER